MALKKRVLVSVTNDLFTDQRVHKVCTFIQKQGYEVCLVGRLLPNSQKLNRTYETKRMRLRFHKGALFYANYNLRLFFFLLFQRADIFLANDLDTLPANFLVARLRRKKLVYDSHEYFTEVPELIHRPKIQKVWERIEGFIFPKLDFIYTVNASIAQKYAEKYHKKIAVVRNISPAWEAKKCKNKQELGIPEGKLILIFQGAGINIDRGAEEAVEAMKHLENVCLLFVGDGDVVPQLKEKVIAEKLEEKVLFFGKRPYLEMMNFTYHADLGLSLDKDTNPNYQFSLPNKIFDYIHAGTPILATKLVEITKIVETYDVGFLLEKLSVEALVQQLQEIQKNPQILENKRLNTQKAAEIENWEKEQVTLAQFYPNQN